MIVSSSSRPRASRTALLLMLAAGALATGACASVGISAAPGAPGAPASSMSVDPPSPDPRIGLKAGWFDAGQASWNLRLVSTTKPSAQFLNPTTPGEGRLTNSDLAFRGTQVFQGNYSGWQVWDISDPRAPQLTTAYVCPGSQSDVTVFGNLLFVSAEAASGRVDCGLQGVQDTVSRERARGIRIIDISDIRNPKYITTVQTCRGSHTNTLVTDPTDRDNVYIYVSGSAPVRSASELAGCSGGPLGDDPNTALFRIEVIRVPLAHPEQAAIVSSPRIFGDLPATTTHSDTGNAVRAARPTTQCHDITVYPAIGLAGGACSGYGLLLDIHDVAHPKRIGAVNDANFAFWHSATFSNDGSKVLFSDEWGGGGQPRCRASDRREWGADALFRIVGTTLEFQSYYKLPAPQTSEENCVAHNGSLIPIPGRDVMVQAWYQGGISVFDWTDAKHPREIAFFDRGPMDSTKLVMAGHWSAYWYNGYIVGSEISRGLDIWELTPSAHLSRNEIEAAKSVRFDHFNPQEQPKFVWPASFVVARAYLDQLTRGDGLAASRVAAIASALDRAERESGGARQSALTQLASQLDTDAAGAADAARVRAIAGVVRDLAR